MQVQTHDLIDAAGHLGLLAERLESSIRDADVRARRTAGIIDERTGAALASAWQGVHEALGVLAAGYRTYARGFTDLAMRYDELDRGLLAPRRDAQQRTPRLRETR